MAEDHELYLKNILFLVAELKNSVIRRIYLSVDEEPTFDKKSIPFSFEYCYSVGILTDKGFIHVGTSMTNSGVETFWSEECENKFPGNFIDLNLIVKDITYDNGYDGYACKLKLDFGSEKIILIAGEIYDTREEKVFDYKINDEMILVFRDENEVTKFAKLAAKNFE